MESILLGAIAYSGLKNDPKNKKGANNTLYNKSTGKGCYGLSYNSDMENSIKKIELNQAKRDHSKPGSTRTFVSNGRLPLLFLFDGKYLFFIVSVIDGIPFI